MILSLNSLYVGMVLSDKNYNYFTINQINDKVVHLLALDFEFTMNYDDVVKMFVQHVSNDGLETLIEENDDEF